MQSWMIGMVSGIIFTGSWPFLPPWPLSLLFAALAAGALRWKSGPARLFSGLACGCALGLVHGTLLLQQRLTDDCASVPLIVTGRISSLPIESTMPGDIRRQRFEFTVRDLAPKHCSGPARLMLSYYGDHRILPGDEWQFEVKLKKPWGLANPGSFNMQVWFSQEGIGATGSVRESGRTQQLSSAGGVYALHHRLRLMVSERIGGLDLDPDVAAILRAITVADKSGIDPRLWTLFQQFGINHLLVISGLHVGMVAGVGYLLGGLYARIFSSGVSGGSWIPGLTALLLACLYGALAGFSLPTQRALCMLGCFVVAGLAGRRSGSGNNLLLAATVVLVLNPLAALGSGFWLSFGAVAALLWLARWQQGIGFIGRLLSTHGFMSLVMLPLGALFFGGGSLVSMLANLVMIPLVGWVVVPLGLMAVLFFWCGWSVESTLWRWAGWPLEQILPLARALSDMGGTWLYLPLSANLPQVLLGVIAVTLFILPGGKVLKLIALVLALPMLLPRDMSAQAPSLATRVTVLDVGQGTAVLVRSKDRALLYDTGGGNPDGVNIGSMAVLPYLQQQGVASLDTLVISHPDLDHSAGTAVILSAMTVDRFRYGGPGPGVGEGRPCIAGESWRWPGGQVFQFLSPAQETLRKRNDSSCVLQIQVGKYRLLLPGDIENERERTLVQYWGEELSSNWLLAAHHGSRTSSSSSFLKWVQPEAAVISSGYANRFGHPHPSVIQRLDAQGVTTLSTATEGALDFEVVPGQALQINAYRSSRRRYWM